MSDEPVPRRPSTRHDLVVAELDGELVVFDPIGALVHQLDRLGALIWPFLDGSATIDELADDLAAAFEQPVEVVRADVVALVSRLAERHLLEGTAPTEPPRPAVRDKAGYLVDPPSP